jgi:hypothetical protein
LNGDPSQPGEGHNKEETIMIREFSFHVMTGFVYTQMILSAVIFSLYLIAIVKVPARWRGKFIKSFSHSDKAWFYAVPLITLFCYGLCHHMGLTIAQMARFGNMFVDLIAVIVMLFGGLPRALLIVKKASYAAKYEAGLIATHVTINRVPVAERSTR